MGLWSWLADRLDHFLHDPTDNVNTGLVANPFVVQQTPNAADYAVGAAFGDPAAGGTQRTTIELWASDATSTVHVGEQTEQGKPAYLLTAAVNGMLTYVPPGQVRDIPGTDRVGPARQVTGPAYVLRMIPSASRDLAPKLDSDLWILSGLAPANRPRPTVVVYENVHVDTETEELIRALYRLERKAPLWQESDLDALVTSWRDGESTVYVPAGLPIGFPRSDPPPGAAMPAGSLPTGARCVRLEVFDELGVPFDLGWLLRHADLHAEDDFFDDLVAPDVTVFRKSPLRDLLPRRMILDLRDAHGRPYAGRAFRLFDEAATSGLGLAGVFDLDGVELQLSGNMPETTGSAGLWVGPTVPAGGDVEIHGVGIHRHLMAFLPSCPASSVVLKLRGYPGDYYRMIALHLDRWYPEQPNQRAAHAPRRYHLGCRVTPLVDGQAAQSAIADALRATYEMGPDDPFDNRGLRPEPDRQASFVWLCNWRLGLHTFPYGGSPALYDAVDPSVPGNPDFTLGNSAYPAPSLGYYLQKAIAAGVGVRGMIWYNLFGGDPRGNNIEAVHALNRYYDFEQYHLVGGGEATDRDPVDVSGMDPIPPNLHRGWCILDDKTRGVGAHHQKATVIRNRYGDLAFVGGIDLFPSRWDTSEHRSGEPRKQGSGWHDVHTMVEGPAVADVALNFFQRWNAFLANLPGPADGYPLDVAELAGLTPLPAQPVVDPQVPEWNGPRRPTPDDDGTPPATLDAGDDGPRPAAATHVVAVVRTIPPYIDAYDGFVQARPDASTPDAVLGELGCHAAVKNAIANARRFVYIEDQYFVEPEVVDLCIARLTHVDPAERLGQLFVIIPHIIADNPINDGIYHHKRREAVLRIRQAVRTLLAGPGGDPASVPQDDVDEVFTCAHLQHPTGTQIYVHAKHTIVDDLWMLITSSNISRRGMSYETEIGVAVTDAAVEDGVRKAVRDHRVRLWAEHLQLERHRWHLLVDPRRGLELMREGLDNPNLVLIRFQESNPNIPYSYPAQDHDADHELIYEHISDPDGREPTDIAAVQAAQQLAEDLL